MPGFPDIRRGTNFYISANQMNFYKFHITNIEKIYLVTDIHEIEQIQLARKGTSKTEIYFQCVFPVSGNKDIVCFEFNKPLINRRDSFMQKKDKSIEKLYITVTDPKKLVKDVMERKSVYDLNNKE